jgi:hypothetical protein
MCSLSLKILHDQFAFWVFEFLFFILFMRSVISDFGWFNSNPEIAMALTRGDESWKCFVFVYTTTALIFLELINTTKAVDDYKTIITIANMAMLLYLCFYNSWFRNQIVGIVMKSKDKVEQH